ncbi:hypothetical protein GPECTOR_56g412 [Gonium pectorale]|uniref:Uncharacterized protein n=1 Tax=Gonium pectorale TaxID=33097 RepID=A0A150G6Z9_GONPE|nr:hypothetical protein GPECTOR_56g412 [Gonium pectorale]|eukprot:KXZ45315.1 hypothetical protein GPECTOR_56g412 [Gonium pectorale]
MKPLLHPDAPHPAADDDPAASAARVLTYRILKASSLREVDALLKGRQPRHHGGRPGGGHTAGTARHGSAGGEGASGGVGGVVAVEAAAAPNMIHLAAAARQAVLLGSVAAPGEARALLDRHLLRLTARIWAAPPPPQPASSGSAPGLTAASRAPPAAATTAAAAAANVTVGGVSAAHAEADSAAQPPAAAAAAAPPPSVPLRELGDVLWAYGRLRCKPPPAAWAGLLRPMLLDPAALAQLRSAAAPPPSQALVERRRRGDRDEEDGAAAGAAGQELTKLAVALARMREQDVEVWRLLARATAASAPGLSPRALTSVLWAFGAARMTHGPLLAAAVRAVRLQLPSYNAQDLTCAMWALARLAPPDAPLGGSAASRSAAAVAAARELLYGDLSDAARRSLQQRGFKPPELATLIGAVDEMAGHVEQDHAPAGSHQLSPRLLRVLSQAVRKSMAQLPVGALAEAAAAFRRAGVADAALYRSLAAGLGPRLRHLGPRQLLRAAEALLEAGHADGGFYSRVMVAATPGMAAASPDDLLALVDLCCRLAGAEVSPGAAETGAEEMPPRGAGPAGSVDGAGSGRGAGEGGNGGYEGYVPNGTPPLSSPPPLCTVPPDVVRSLIHEAVLRAVALAEGRQQQPVGGGGGGSGAANAAAAGGEALRLRHWHRLLRAAAAAGWRDEALAGRAADGMLGELAALRPAWLGAVRARAAAEAAGSGGQGYDLTAGDVAAIVHTAATLRLRRRGDVVTAVAAALMDGLNAAAEGYAGGGKAGGAALSAGSGRHLAAMPAAPAPAGAGPGLALAPAAAAELAAGLDYFAPTLDSLAQRTAKAAVAVLRRRLRLPEPAPVGAAAAEAAMGSGAGGEGGAQLG